MNSRRRGVWGEGGERRWGIYGGGSDYIICSIECSIGLWFDETSSTICLALKSSTRRLALKSSFQV